MPPPICIRRKAEEKRIILRSKHELVCDMDGGEPSRLIRPHLHPSHPSRPAQVAGELCKPTDRPLTAASPEQTAVLSDVRQVARATYLMLQLHSKVAVKSCLRPYSLRFLHDNCMRKKVRRRFSHGRKGRDTQPFAPFSHDSRTRSTINAIVAASGGWRDAATP